MTPHAPDTDVIRELFAREIPEIGQATVEIKAVAREVGHWTQVAVAATEPAIDPIAACLGDRGCRIRSIVKALGGERIDLIHWTGRIEKLLRSALQPAEPLAVVIDDGKRRATVFLEAEQQPLLAGRSGLQRRLAEQLTGYEVVLEKVGRTTKPKTGSS